jgi:hypothetical protein
MALLLGCLLSAGVAPLATAQAPQSAAKMRAPVAQPPLQQSGAPQGRSAQSNCVREANRRGFVVLDTRNFQQHRDGWSIDMRVRNYRGQATDGSCFVETQSGDVTLYGFGWGYDDDGDDRMQFNCASIDNRYRECQLPVNGRVTLVKRQSKAGCTEGHSWGQRGDRLWVDHGCRGVFEVNRYGGSGGGGIRQVDCNSDYNRYRECAIGAGYFGRLARESSRGRCREGQTWGTRNGVIWVTDGCRGRFDVVRGSGGGQAGQGLFDCRSTNGQFRECSIGRGNSARLVREYSNGRCRANSTWGVRNGYVWVTSGCMAQFQRISGGGGYSGGG